MASLPETLGPLSFITSTVSAINSDAFAEPLHFGATTTDKKAVETVTSLDDAFSMSADFWLMVSEEPERQRLHLVNLTKDPRSPYVLHSSNPSVVPHIVVTSPSWMDDSNEPWAIMHNTLPVCANPESLGAPTPLLDWVTARPPVEDASEYQEGDDDEDWEAIADFYNAQSASEEEMQQQQEWSDPATPLLMFYRSHNAIVLESDVPQEAPHIVISRPYEPPVLVALARTNNVAPAQLPCSAQGVTLLSVADAANRPLPWYQVHDAAATAAAEDKVEDQVVAVENSTPGVTVAATTDSFFPDMEEAQLFAPAALALETSTQDVEHIQEVFLSVDSDDDFSPLVSPTASDSDESIIDTPTSEYGPSGLYEDDDPYSFEISLSSHKQVDKHRVDGFGSWYSKFHLEEDTMGLGPLPSW